MKGGFALLDVLGALVLILLALTVVFRFNHRVEQRLYQTGEARNRLRHAAWRLTLGDGPPKAVFGQVEQRDRRVWVVHEGPHLYYIYAPAEVPGGWTTAAEADPAP